MESKILIAVEDQLKKVLRNMITGTYFLKNLANEYSFDYCQKSVVL